jgi:hypothetical protein
MSHINLWVLLVGTIVVAVTMWFTPPRAPRGGDQP